ncbi:MAG: hypothetical protein V4858_15075 [Pseudomonadota bacterium]
MGKLVAMVGLACAAAWYYFVGGAKLDEDMVRQFYVEEAHATLARKPEALCALMSSKLVVTQETRVLGQTNTETLNKKQACEAQHQAFQQFKEMGDKADAMLTIEYDYTIDSIDISPNRKQAVVQVSNTLKMGGQLMQFRTASTDQLRREWGMVKIAKADSKTQVQMHLAGMQDPAKYLQSR